MWSAAIVFNYSVKNMYDIRYINVSENHQLNNEGFIIAILGFHGFLDNILMFMYTVWRVLNSLENASTHAIFHHIP